MGVIRVSLTNSPLEAVVDVADADLVRGRRWRLDGDGYVVTTWKGRVHRLHRLVKPGVGLLDHINCNPRDNRRCNLRPCTTAQNGMNRRPDKGGLSRFKGVTLHRQTGKWQAAIRTRYLGLFSTEEDAARAYDAAAYREFGSFARTNEMEGLL